LAWGLDLPDDLGPGRVFAADSATFGVSAVFLSHLAVPGTARGRSSSVGAELTAGWHAFASRRWLWRSVASRGVWNFAFAPFFVLGPVIALRDLGGSLAWGIIAAALGAGMVVGGLLAMHVAPARPLVVGNLALTLSGLPLLGPHSAATHAADRCTALIGFAGVMLLNGLWFTTLQGEVPGETLSRVSSLDWLVSCTAMPLGLALAGPVVTIAGARPALLGSAALLVAAAGLTATDPAVRRVHRPPAAPPPRATTTPMATATTPEPRPRACPLKTMPNVLQVAAATPAGPGYMADLRGDVRRGIPGPGLISRARLESFLALWLNSNHGR
jgi:hypothetical protein